MKFKSGILLLFMYVVIFSIGLGLIILGRDWRGYVALISTPLLHTLIKGIEKQLATQKETRQPKAVARATNK